ncbi:STM3941 family protein [Dongia sp.]|uniref:STM3941 family protein n=1 Tax=Dongia sp. TaxID=1977262 RepID=UPI0035B2B6F4
MDVCLSRKGLLASCAYGCVLLLMGWVFSHLDGTVTNRLEALISACLRGLGFLGLGVSFLVLTWSFSRLARPRPALQFDEKGITVTATGPFSGFIAWSEIKSGCVGSYRGCSTLDITVADRKAVISRLPLWRRACLCLVFPFSATLVQIPAFLLSADVGDIVKKIEAQKKAPPVVW